MTLRITGLALLPLDLPMRQPFVTALGQKKLSRNLLVAVRLSNGLTGYGEASESLAWPQDSREAMTRVLNQTTPRLIGASIRAYHRLVAIGWETAGAHPTAAAALECALVDAAARANRSCLWCWFGGKRRSLTTDLTLSAWKPPIAARAATVAARRGFRRFKIKVTGRDLEEDFRRVAAVRAAVSRATLLIDGNQGFSVNEAVRFSRLLRERKIPVKLFEQPVAKENRDGLMEVQREGKIPVMADESVRGVEEARRLIRKHRLFGLNVKVAKSGLFGAMEIIRLARKTRTRLMIGCMAESRLGISHSVALACGTGAFDFVDLDSHLLTACPPCETGFIAKGSRLLVRAHRMGSGIEFPTGRAE